MTTELIYTDGTISYWLVEYDTGIFAVMQKFYCQDPVIWSEEFTTKKKAYELVDTLVGF